MDLLAHCGPWTIDVCEDCGRTRQDMSHGKCSTPTRWRKVEVAPVNQPPGAVSAIEEAFGALTNREITAEAARARAGVVLQSYLNATGGQ